jgi:hypothetical protein
MEKVIRTYNVTESRETISVTVEGENTDIIEQVVITDEDGTVVSNQKLRTTMPTSEARSIIEAAVKAA